MAWSDVSYLLRSPVSKRILEAIENEPLAPFEISKRTNTARSNISSKLIELKKKELVKCINPEARKWRFYEITEQGKELLKEVRKRRPST